MDASFKGARWWRFDLHCHTPASHDYGREDPSLKEIGCRDWLLAYMARGLDCVAVTDHNSGQWIDDLKREYAALEADRPEGFRELWLFPGVELSVNGGIHLLALFDPGKTKDYVVSLLAKAGIAPAAYGETSSVTKESLEKTVGIITELGGIAIPAHVDGPAGLFTEVVDGPTLRPILTCQSLYAAELNEPGSMFPELYTTHKASWARVAGSDAHKPIEIGRRFTWIKMGTPSIEGLRLALMDGELSVKASYDPPSQEDRNNHASFTIRNISIGSSRYAGRGTPLVIDFSPWLTCLIGGRGSGKSTVVEFLRLVFHREGDLAKLGSDSEVAKQFSQFAQLYTDRSSRGVLLPETRLEALCQEGDGQVLLTWEQSPERPVIRRRDSPLRGWTPSPGDEVQARFPVQVFSQKQIYDMALNQQALLGLVDEALGDAYRDWLVQAERLKTQYRSLRAQRRELDVDIERECQLRGELDDLASKLGLLEKGENARLFKDYELGRLQGKETDLFHRSLLDAAASLEEVRLEALSPDMSLFEGIEEGRLVASLMEDYSKRMADLDRRLGDVRRSASELATGFIAALEGSPWHGTVAAIKARYADLIEELRRNGVEDPEAHDRLVQRMQLVESQLADIDKKKTRRDELDELADKELRRLDEHRSSLSRLRADFLSRALQGNDIVRMSLEERGFVKHLEQELREILNKDDGTFQDDILSEDQAHGLLGVLVKDGYSQEAWERLKRALLDLRAGGVNGFSQRFVSFMTDRVTDSMMDELALWIPEDAIRVEYCRDKARRTWEALEQGSAGQKTASILAFILAYGSDPIILDQPEDDLDNHLIYNFVVEQVRRKKLRRQVIIITHNPNIVVNGDAELVHSLAFLDGRIQVARSGCLQDREVRDEICQVMEGGAQAFERRYRRIHVEGTYV